MCLLNLVCVLFRRIRLNRDDRNGCGDDIAWSSGSVDVVPVVMVDRG